jgi:hypothetical protein
MSVGKDGISWPVNAPYVTMAGLNLLACDLTAATTAVTAVVPVTRSFEKASGTHGATLLASSSTIPTGLSSDGGALKAFVT